MQNNQIYHAGLYLRLSKDDEREGESLSIGTQRSILTDYCASHGYKICEIYVDDGYSGMNFNRPGFQKMLEDIESGIINMVITKDLSRLGRDYIMTGYYSELYFPAKDVRYIAVADDFDSTKDHNDIAPFKNILNDMYARDISRKITHAKRQRAKQGLFIGAQTPYGYCVTPSNKNLLIVDPEAAAVVRMIFRLAEQGLGSIAIAAELKERRIYAPSAYKFMRGDKRFERYPAVKNGDYYDWCPATISQLLKNRVYIGELTALKTITTNCKTKQLIPAQKDHQIITPNAHEAIICPEQFERVQQIRMGHVCRANHHRFNLFRGKLFCDCCGHQLIISKKQLLDRTTDMYLCMHHFNHPDICPRTHRIYHDMLYPYILQQIQSFAKSMKRRKVSSPLSQYADIKELTPEILDAVIERIEVGHVTRKSRPGHVIRIYWKLR